MQQIAETFKEKGMSSVRLSNDLKSKLVKIGAKLSLKDGKARTMEDIIDMLVKEYEKDHKE